MELKEFLHESIAITQLSKKNLKKDMTISCQMFFDMFSVEIVTWKQKEKKVNKNYAISVGEITAYDCIVQEGMELLVKAKIHC